MYRIEDVRWLVADDRIAVCVYRFRWNGEGKDGPVSREGRGTSVLRNVGGSWKVMHEHLSRYRPP